MHVHLVVWKVVKSPPDNGDFNKVCQLCFPLGFPEVAKPKEAVSADTDASMPIEITKDLGSDSSSTSSDSSE